ncbi:MAG: hypothetical protein AAGG68_03580 [Bacteroidota bacterium]
MGIEKVNLRWTVFVGIMTVINIIIGWATISNQQTIIGMKELQSDVGNLVELAIRNDSNILELNKKNASMILNLDSVLTNHTKSNNLLVEQLALLRKQNGTLVRQLSLLSEQNYISKNIMEGENIRSTPNLSCTTTSMEIFDEKIELRTGFRLLGRKISDLKISVRLFKLENNITTYEASIKFNDFDIMFPNEEKSFTQILDRNGYLSDYNNLNNCIWAIIFDYQDDLIDRRKKDIDYFRFDMNLSTKKVYHTLLPQELKDSVAILIHTNESIF